MNLFGNGEKCGELKHVCLSQLVARSKHWKDDLMMFANGLETVLEAHNSDKNAIAKAGAVISINTKKQNLVAFVFENISLTENITTLEESEFVDIPFVKKVLIDSNCDMVSHLSEHIRDNDLSASLCINIEQQDGCCRILMRNNTKALD